MLNSRLERSQRMIVGIEQNQTRSWSKISFIDIEYRYDFSEYDMTLVQFQSGTRNFVLDTIILNNRFNPLLNKK